MSRPTTPLPPSHPTSTSTSTTTSYPLPNGPALPSLKTHPPNNLSSPPRSSTIHHSNPTSSNKPQTHHHHHPHRTHRHHANSSLVPQSAHPTTTHSPFGDMLTKAHRTLAETLPHPVSSSTLSQAFSGTNTPPRANPPNSGAPPENGRREKEAESAAEAGKADDETAAHTLRTQNALLALRARRGPTNATLHSTLSHLSTLSARTSRRLDATYTALQSSLRTQRSSVDALHDLAVSTRELRERVAGQMGEVETEADTAVRGVEEGFKRQGERVKGLEERLSGGRERVKGLQERLERVREEVERQGGREREGRRRRWRVWQVVGALVGGLMLGGGFLSSGRGLRDVEVGNGRVGVGDVTGELAGNGSVAEMKLDHAATRGTEGTGKVDTAATLRLFDEL